MSIFPAAKSCPSKVASPGSGDQAGDTGISRGEVRGFGPMARVTTAFGEVYAQVLRERDRVRTKTGEFLAIASVERFTLDADYLKYHPGAQPILIRADALARGIPAADILLAPFQQLNVDQTFIERAKPKAVDALNRPHVHRWLESMITYTIIHFDKPASVCCEGLWVETSPKAA